MTIEEKKREKKIEKWQRTISNCYNFDFCPEAVLQAEIPAILP